MKNRFNIAVIAGDGIGKEVMPEGIKVLKKVSEKFDINLNFEEFDFSSYDYYEKHGQMMPNDWKEKISNHDAIFFGAVGWPDKIPDHVSLWGSLLKFRREFVVQETIMTKIGVDRVLKFAFNLAKQTKRKHLTSATKSNGISITMPYWDERVEEISKNFPEVKFDKYHIDILCAHFVLNPEKFNVVVGSNLFGDILSDLGPACTGTIGIAPSGNINPEKDFPSLFEPVHGSAPDIAGQNIANPIGQIWAGAMMLDHFGYKEAHDHIIKTIESTISKQENRTKDLGGSAKTNECGDAIMKSI